MDISSYCLSLIIPFDESKCDAYKSLEVFKFLLIFRLTSFEVWFEFGSLPIYFLIILFPMSFICVSSSFESTSFSNSLFTIFEVFTLVYWN